MATEIPQQHPCTPLATLLAGLFARAASTACGADWQIELTDPPPRPLPTPGSPAHYRLRFSDGLRGGCSLVFEQTSVAGFLAAGAEPAQAALLGLLEELGVTLAEALAPSHGAVRIAAEVPELPGETAPEHGLALQARGPAGAPVTLLLYFDAELAECFAASVAEQQDAHSDARREARQDGAADPGAYARAAASSAANLDLVMDVELNCTLRFGQRQLSLREILDLASGSVVELDRQVDEPVELILDGKVIARGEAVIIDGNYGLRVTQVLQPVAY